MADTNNQREPDIDRLLAGDADEFTLLVTQESERLFRVIQRFVKDADEARNVMQETFLQAYERRDTFRRESKFTTWLYAIGINLARAAVRKSSRSSSLDELDVDRLQPDFGANGRPTMVPSRWNPEKMVESAERRRLVREGIERLPEDYKTVVMLRDIEELPTAEVSAILGVSEGAVRVRLHRARQALHAVLSEYFAD